MEQVPPEVSAALAEYQRRERELRQQLDELRGQLALIAAAKVINAEAARLGAAGSDQGP